MTFEESLRLTLKADEGIVHAIYEDHMDPPNATLGIGHLIVFTDREYRWPIHTDISEARVIQLYNHDVGVALKDARWLHPDFDDLPDPARIVIASLSF
ncbi:MAG: hypothetical protein OSB76_11825 [Alphaproteobacteria bacterium]|jgi:hypothetical protein|nr:hypothetical protein [Alphaproteobacteria bacterium]